MPDQPEKKRRPIDVAPVRQTQRIRYAELHLKTNFSFLEGASHPDELVYRAAELGYAAMAVTDRNSLAGVVRAHIAAKQMGLKLLVGAEITPVDAPPVVLLATDRAAYGRLVRLITLGRRNAPKGECRILFDDLAAHAQGLIAAVSGETGDYDPATRILPLPWERAGVRGERRRSAPPHPALSQEERVQRAAVAADSLDDRDHLHRYRELFGDRCYLLAELHCGPNDERQLEQRIALAKQTGVPLVAASDVHFHHPCRRALADVLTAIRARLHGGRGRRAAVSQCRAAFEIAAGNARAVCPRAGGDCAARSKSPSAARFRSTSCVTNIPRNWPAGRDAAGVSDAADLGRGQRALSRRRSRQSAAAASSTSCS